MPGTSPRFATLDSTSVSFEPSGSAECLSLCQEIRTSLTVMFAAYQLAHGADDRLNSSEQRELLERAEHHALRAESLFGTALRTLSQT